MTVNFRMIANLKYMWDGRVHEDEGEALKDAAAFKKEGFDVQLVAEEGKHLLYTRRVAATPPQTHE